MNITPSSRKHLGDRLVVASVSGGKDSTALATPPRLIGHDHLEALGVSERCIREWLASGVLSSPRGDGFYLRGATFEAHFTPLVARRIVGRGHLLALGVAAATMARWLRQGTLRRTAHRGFYRITCAAFEALTTPVPARTVVDTQPAPTLEQDAEPAPAAPLALAPAETRLAPAPAETRLREPAPAAPLALAPAETRLAPAPAETRLRIVACTITRARAFVAEHHRHLGPPLSGLFAVGLARGDDLVGAAIVGRPVARGLQDGHTAEVTRVCTLGDRNACTMLLSACRRGAAALGYHRVITYTLNSEPGTSLRAAGWQETAQVRGRSWNCASRPRDPSTQRGKRRWEAPMSGQAAPPPSHSEAPEPRRSLQ